MVWVSLQCKTSLFLGKVVKQYIYFDQPRVHFHVGYFKSHSLIIFVSVTLIWTKSLREEKVYLNTINLIISQFLDTILHLFKA